MHIIPSLKKIHIYDKRIISHDMYCTVCIPSKVHMLHVVYI